MTVRPPDATIRTQVLLPLRFGDGYATDARVFTFDGLVDGREHVALALGERVAWPRPADGGGAVPLVRLHSECLTGDVLARQGRHTLDLPLLQASLPEERRPTSGAITGRTR